MHQEKEMLPLNIKSISASVEELADRVLGLLGTCTNLMGFMLLLAKSFAASNDVESDQDLVHHFRHK